MSIMSSSKETVISKSPILSALRSPMASADSTKTMDSGYFSEETTLKPSGHRGSVSSTITNSSIATTSTTSDAGIEIRVTTVTTQTTTKLDTLQRHFPKPQEEATVEELLARPPLKGSLAHYVKNARDRRVPVADPEQEKKRFQQAKAELLAMKAAFDLKN